MLRPKKIRSHTRSTLTDQFPPAWYLLRRRHLRRRRLLLLIKPIEDAARLDHAGIGVDVGLRRVGGQQQIALLRLKNGGVLEEGGPDLLAPPVAPPSLVNFALCP